MDVENCFIIKTRLKWIYRENMKRFNDKEKKDLEMAEEAIRKSELLKEEISSREMEPSGEESLTGEDFVEQLVEELHLAARINREKAAARLEARLREMERKKKVARRWLYIGNSVAAVAVLFFMVMTMLPEKKQIEKEMPVFRIAEIKVPTLITTKENDTILSLDTLEVGKNADVYVVGKQSQAQAIKEEEATPEEKPIRNVRVVIPAGYTYNFQLADGTTVTLNAGSELKFPEEFGDSIREVELKGEGYFNVKKSDIPFVVKGGKTRVKVYGTQFNMFYCEKLALSEAVLVEGSIGMTAGGKETMITPNQRILFTMKDSAVRVESVDPADYIAWLGSSFKYNGARLDKIVFDISQWYGVEIELAPGLEKETFSLEFDKLSTIDWVVRALGLIINKPIKTEGGVYYIE